MSLNELPEEVYVPLGSRGFHPVRLKQCFKCGHEDVEDLELLGRDTETPDVENMGKEVVNYKIRCKKCGYTFTVQCRNFYESKGDRWERVASFVHILNEDGSSQGWLGNF